MTTLKEQLSADIVAVFYNNDEFAETVVYNGADVLAIVNRGSSPNITETVATECSIRVQVSEVPSPAYRDVVVIGSDTFYVLQDDRETPRKTDDGLEWIIPLYSDERGFP